MSSELQSSVTLTKYSIVIQLVFRISTFFLNAFVLRFITRETLGVVNVRLTLLYMNGVFLSREAFRRACLGQDKRRIDNGLVNLLWLVLPVGGLVSGILGFLWIRFVDVDVSVFPDYPGAVLFFLLAGLCELLSEPLAILSQLAGFVRLRAAAEGAAALVKCLLTAGLVSSGLGSGLTPFCVAQIAYCCTISIIFYGYYLYFFQRKLNKKCDFPLQSFRHLFPSFSSVKSHSESGRLILSFWFQSVLKQLLTEGEKFVMTFFNLISLANQGVYDIVSNLGSLVARSFFLPVEDGAFHYFSRNLQRGLPAKEQNEVRLKETASTLANLLTCLSLIGCCFAFFGQAYSFLLLHLYGGNILSSGAGPSLLRWHCGYVLLLAWNGVTEGFMTALMAKEEVDRHSSRMMLYSGVFLVCAVVFVRFAGVVGFLWANYVNMALRVVVSVRFLRRFCCGSQFEGLWRHLLPDPVVLVTFAAAAVVTLYSEMIFCCSTWTSIFIHVGIGGVCLAGVSVVVLLRHQFLRTLFLDAVMR